MTIATAIANPNIAFTKYSDEKLTAKFVIPAMKDALKGEITGTSVLSNLSGIAPIH